MSSLLPSRIGPLHEPNMSGSCRMLVVPVTDVLSMAPEVNGTVASIVLKEGKFWREIRGVQWTQVFTDQWRTVDGSQMSYAVCELEIPKDRVALLAGLWGLKNGRYIVLSYSMSGGPPKLMGTLSEPATLRSTELTHGADPSSSRNKYWLRAEVARRRACPFYQGTPPTPALPDSCPTLAQLLGDEDWNAIEALLTPEQLAEAEASLSSSLCELIDEAFVGSTTLLDAVVISGAEVVGVTNGTYPEVSIDNGKPRYELGDAFVTWTGTAWIIAFTGAGGSYYSLEDVDYPWQVTAWLLYGDFTGELPTVEQDSESTGGDGSAILDCLSTEQGTTLFTALLVDRAWSAIEALLSPTQLAAAEASLGGGGGTCPTLCELIDEAFSGGGGAGENSFTVSGAGISGFNVQFTVDGTNNGKDAYRNGNLSCSWSGTAWVMLDDTDGSGWWQSTSDTEFPWEATGWTAMFSYVGQAAPTLTQDGAGGGNAILDCLSPEQAQTLFEGLIFADTPVVTLPQTRIPYADEVGDAQVTGPYATDYASGTIRPDLLVARRQLTMNGFGIDKWVTLERLISNTVPDVTVAASVITRPDGTTQNLDPEQPLDVRDFRSGIRYALNFGMWSGTEAVYQNGDEGTLYGTGFFDYIAPIYPLHTTRLVDWFTLFNNNIFGNTNRFTDRSGLQLYPNRIIMDHYTGLEWYSPTTALTGIWSAAISAGVALNYQGNSDWRVPPLGLLQTIIRNATGVLLNYAPFNIPATTVWSSTTNVSSTTNAIPMISSGTFQSTAKSGSGRYFFCRRFI